MVSELIEMGFPVDSVISAVVSAKMNKEQAVLQLLDPDYRPHDPSSLSSATAATPTNVAGGSSNQSHHSRHYLGMPVKKSKKKDDQAHKNASKKNGLSSYLSAKH